VLAVRRENFRVGTVGRDFRCIKYEPDIGAVQGAAAFGVANVDGLTVTRERLEPFILLRKPNLE